VLKKARSQGLKHGFRRIPEIPRFQDSKNPGIPKNPGKPGIQKKSEALAYP